MGAAMKTKTQKKSKKSINKVLIEKTSVQIAEVLPEVQTAEVLPQSNLDTSILQAYKTARLQYRGMIYGTFKIWGDNLESNDARAIYTLIAFMHNNEMGTITKFEESYFSSFCISSLYALLEQFAGENLRNLHNSQNPLSSGLYRISKPATGPKVGKNGVELPDYYGRGELACYRERVEGNESKARPLRLDSGLIFSIHDKQYTEPDNEDMIVCCKFIVARIKAWAKIS
jgi:hypothetical protein